VPLRPSQLDKFEKTISKYREQSVFTVEDEKEWNDWLDEQKQRLGEECSTCFELTTQLRQQGKNPGQSGTGSRESQVVPRSS
jgi:hypothetical protein